MRKRVLALMFLLPLLLCMCGASGSETEESVLERGEERNILSALDKAWRREEEDREIFGAAGSGNIQALQGNNLFVIRKKRVYAYHLENGGFYNLSSIDVGFYWSEHRDENGWTGCEKTPQELFVSGERLAVVSDWVEFTETYSDGTRSFSDLSRTVIDIFDISNPAAPVPVASYGQDGGQFAGYADAEGHLWLLSRRSIYEADYGLPAVYNSEHRIELESDCIDVQSSGGRAQMVVLGLYDLTDGVRWNARALIGGGDRALLGADGAYILGGGTDTAVIHYAVSSEKVCLPKYMSLRGSLLDAALGESELFVATDTGKHTLFSALKSSLEPLWERELYGEARDWGFGKDCFRVTGETSLKILNLSDRSLREGKLRASCAARLDEKHWVTLDYNRDGSAMDLVLLRAGAKGTLKEAEGFLLHLNYRPAAEEPNGLWLHDDLLALASETGCSFFRCGSDGFAQVQDVFTSDNSANMRYYLLGDYLYVADTREVHALRLSDLAFVGEWFL